MKLKPAKSFSFPGYITDSVAGSVCRLQRLAQKIGLRFIREQLNLGCKLHCFTISETQRFEKGGMGVLKEAVSAARF